MTAINWPQSCVSRFVQAGGLRTRVLDFGGPDDAPLVICLHGFGGSALNWGLLGPLLSEHFRVQAIDLEGHGLTASGERSSIESVLRQVSAMLETPGPAYLVGNSFGGVLALMQASRDASRLAGLVIIGAPTPARPDRSWDPVMLAKRYLIAVPGVSALMRRRMVGMSPREVVEEQVRAAGSQPGQLDTEMLEASVALQETRHHDAAAHRGQQLILRSLLSVFVKGKSFLRMTARIRVPVLWIQGGRDALVPAATARAFVDRHPDWDYECRDAVGHVPQLDDPTWAADLIGHWIHRAPVSPVPND